ncbi:MAG: phosphoenolpyruvate carboxykinase (GTP), partial [Spirochaetes bacterium]|nr:phosphoenolpyruvate carboxykinase (GTP) [Spirochaetota bacterium]
WPGFGENSRILKWIFERCDGAGEAVETSIGIVPAPGALDLEGLDAKPEAIAELLAVREDEWLADVPGIRAFFGSFHDGFPEELSARLEWLERRLRNPSAHKTRSAIA